ncbi:MAG TPA: TRAP transporter substrate-binding protein DctP [Burkholderiaceae bacterium]|jgi:TRAP-type C4-dicarboxylate transport system substrate-binding protein|nr:TRAP transporter substrate-binding protein DctP [Burkholderiaceae bacterium]
MQQSRRGFLATTTAGAATVTLGGAAQAAEKWDMFVFPGATHPITLRLKEFADEVAKRTNGYLSITVRPQGEFPFKATEVVRATGLGQVQLGEAYSGFISGAAPMSAIANLPFLVRTSDELTKIWPIVSKYAEAEFAKAGVKTLFYFEWPEQNLWGRGPAVRRLEDFAGRKFRTTDVKQAEMLRRLGAASVSLTLAEVPQAVERGLVEGFITAGFNVMGAKWYEFVKWGYTPGIHVGGPDYVLINLAAYNKLPANVRSALDAVAAEWGPRMTRQNLGDEAKDRETLRTKHGVDLYTPPQAELDRMVERMREYWTQWADQQGPAGQAAVREIRAALGR